MKLKYEIWLGLVIILFNAQICCAESTWPDIKSCNDCFEGGLWRCDACIYQERKAPISIPLQVTEPTAAAFAQLDENHRNFESGNARHYVLPGQGPFGSMGASGEHILEANEGRLRGSRRVYVPLAHTRHHLHVAEVFIGTPGQLTRPIVDTGSTNFWAIIDECKEQSCLDVNRFDPKESETFEEYPSDQNYQVTFGTGAISGTAGLDSVSVGNITATNQTVLLVTKEYGTTKGVNIFDHLRFEGVLGLGGAGLSSTPESPSLLQNLMKQTPVKSREFAIYSTAAAGVLLLGGVEERLFQPPIIMFPVHPLDGAPSYWQTKITSLHIGDTKVCCDNEPGYIIVDSGTSFNSMPHDDFKILKKLSEGVNCKTDGYPNIKFRLPHVSIDIEPKDYVSDATGGKCRPQIMQLDIPNHHKSYVFGSLFMRQFFTVFQLGEDGTPLMMGFAKVNPSATKETVDRVKSRPNLKASKDWLLEPE